MKPKLLIPFFLCQLIVFSSYGQKDFRYADKQYEKMRYAHAIEQYELALKYKEPVPAVYKKLAHSYFRVGDMKNAERVYDLYFKDTTENTLSDAEAIFEYSQALSQNGHYEKAALWYEKYHILKGHEDPRGKDHHTAYMERIHEFYRDSVLYQVFRLDINSPQADFSPAFYDTGVVFCSARQREHGVRRVHSYNNAAFLDLYYIDTGAVNERAYETSLHPEHYDHKVYSYLHGNEELHSDETHQTSNDSYTVGYHAHIFRNDTTDVHSFDPTPFSNRLNTKFHEGPLTFNKDQSMVLFTRNSYHKGFGSKGADKVNRLKIYIATKNEKGKWRKVHEFPFNSNDYSTGHPAFAPDGKTVIFASDRPGGEGESDLYRTVYENGNWTEPENLGPVINTEGKELFPFIDNRNVLYFSSNGHTGIGGLDIFKFEKDTVKHLNYPVSSKKDDFGAVVWDNGRKGYLSSNRDFGGFDDDLYFFKSSPILLLAGNVYDRRTKEILPFAEVVLKDTAGKVIEKTLADSLGYYQFQVHPETYYKVKGSKANYYDTIATVQPYSLEKQVIEQDLYLRSGFDVILVGVITDRQTGDTLENVHVQIYDKIQKSTFLDLRTPEHGFFQDSLYNLQVTDVLTFRIHLAKEGYLSKAVDFIAVVTGSGVINLHEVLDVQMDKIEVGKDLGKMIDLKPIYFDLDQWDIRPDAAEELDKIVELMKENPNLVIELGSHTDCRSSRAYNQQLSDRRAKASANYVISRGIPRSRIYGKGYGESKLINDCECEGTKVTPCSEAQHQLNRRTEFIIIKK